MQRPQNTKATGGKPAASGKRHYARSHHSLRLRRVQRSPSNWLLDGALLAKEGDTEGAIQAAQSALDALAELATW